jgi:hypothetical protein
MSATNLDAIIDRVRSICVSAPFSFVETTALDSFNLAPTGVFDGTFRVEGQSQQPRGWMNFMEECTDLLTVTVAKAINNDYQGTRRTLHRSARSLTSAIVRDGVVTSGLYNVIDASRQIQVTAQPSASFLTLRLTVPVNYEAQL